MSAPAMCRVCLVRDRTMYRIANTKLEDAYEIVTKVKLQQVGHPVTLCCICVSQLHRCHRFSEAAQEANNMLDQWYKNTTDDLKLTARPLLSLAQTSPTIAEFPSNRIQEVEVKQEIITDDNESNTTDNNQTIHTKYIKCEFEEIGNKLHTNDNTLHVEIIKHEQVDEQGNDKTWELEKVNQNAQISNFNKNDTVKCEMIIDGKKYSKIQQQYDVTVPSTLNVGYSNNRLTPPNMKGIKLENHIKRLPALKKLRPNETQQRLAKTDAPAKPGKKTYSCDECDFKTIFKRDLNLHAKTHTNATPLTCNECDYKTYHKSHLTRHLFNHSGEKPFPCPECDHRCTTKSDLKRHLVCHKDQKPFQCDQCDFKCNRKENLKQHYMTHTGEKPFACDRCNFKTNRVTKLRMHLKSHTGEEPYSCGQCSYRTGSRSDFKRHSMRHAGEKPLACHLCDFKCLLKFELNRHIATHSGTKPFSCDQCDYKSTQKRLLKLHLMKHSGDKPFSCDNCSFKSSRKDKLKMHILKVHVNEKRVYACVKCVFKTRRKRDLKKHYTAHSRDNIPTQTFESNQHTLDNNICYGSSNPEKTCSTQTTITIKVEPQNDDSLAEQSASSHLTG